MMRDTTPPTSRWILGLGLLALLVHIGSLGIGLATLTPGAELTVQSFVWMHFCVMALGLPFVLILRGETNRWSSVRGLGPKEQSKASQQFWKRLWAQLPWWIRGWSITLLFVGLTQFFTIEGTVRFEDGAYGLYDHGTLLRELTQAEAIEVRHKSLRSFALAWAYGGLVISSILLVAVPRSRRLGSTR